MGKTQTIWFLLPLLLGACRTAPLSSAELYGRPAAGDAAPEAAADLSVDQVVVPDQAVAVDSAPAPDSPAAVDAEPADAADTADAADAADPLCPEEPAEGPPLPCEPNRREAGFSGSVIDACEPNRHLNANVSIGGQRRCSGAGKGAFDFQLLQVGCKLTLVAARPGYQRYCRVVTAPRAGYTIRLERLGGCTAPFPGPTACTCVEPGCMSHTGE